MVRPNIIKNKARMSILALFLFFKLDYTNIMFDKKKSLVYTGNIEFWFKQSDYTNFIWKRK